MTRVKEIGEPILTADRIVALGFVLIFKASGVFNFALGTVVLFAALTFVGMIERGVPIWGAFVIAAAVMVLARRRYRTIDAAPARQSGADHLCSWRPIGLAFFLDGFGQLVWGSDVHPTRSACRWRAAIPTMR